MAENDAPRRTLEDIVSDLAETIHHVPDEDVYPELRKLLIEFAEEIQRRSIEP